MILIERDLTKINWKPNTNMFWSVSSYTKKKLTPTKNQVPIKYFLEQMLHYQSTKNVVLGRGIRNSGIVLWAGAEISEL